MEMLNKGIKVAVYEPLIDKGEFLKGAEIVGFLESLVKKSYIIITNRMCEELVPYKEIVYTRDVFFRD